MMYQFVIDYRNRLRQLLPNESIKYIIAARTSEKLLTCPAAALVTLGSESWEGRWKLLLPAVLNPRLGLEIIGPALADKVSVSHVVDTMVVVASEWTMEGSEILRLLLMVYTLLKIILRLMMLLRMIGKLILKLARSNIPFFILL